MGALAWHPLPPPPSPHPKVRDYLAQLESHLGEAARQAGRLVAKETELTEALGEFGQVGGGGWRGLPWDGTGARRGVAVRVPVSRAPETRLLVAWWCA
jgi:hypothetical protein